ncbi:CotH kinase family protein [Algibacter sp. Ld11]|uniref:CotH kinase family protein n=1 Tax=Algibacter sp. Ld11 TaxID=649150 RepID=UPI00386D8609
MKKFLLCFFVIGTSLTSCSKFNESLNDDFTNANEALVSDFNTPFPVINITVNQNEFDNMYLNYTEGIELEAFLNLYRNNELLISDELVEIEIKGTESATYNLKSLGVKFDDTFKNENNIVVSPSNLLPHHSIEKIKAFRLRNSGNDFKKTLLKDISYTQLAINAGLDVDLTYYEPAIVFINNSFSGIMNLRTEGNTNGISRLNDVKKGAITLAKINDPGEVEKKDGDFDRIDNFLNAIEEENLSYLKQDIDINNFIDYIIFHTYISNVDWPYNNVRFYAIEDEPFRFIIYDLDWANTRKIDKHPLAFINNPTKYSAKDAIKNPITDLFTILYQDSEFKNLFNSRYQYLVNSNAFSSEKFNAILDHNYNNIKQYMPIHLDKYNDIGSMIEWFRNIELLKENFKKREESINDLSPLF